MLLTEHVPWQTLRHLYVYHWYILWYTYIIYTMLVYIYANVHVHLCHLLIASYIPSLIHQPWLSSQCTYKMLLTEYVCNIMVDNIYHSYCVPNVAIATHTNLCTIYHLLQPYYRLIQACAPCARLLQTCHMLKHVQR